MRLHNTTLRRPIYLTLHLTGCKYNQVASCKFMQSTLEQWNSCYSVPFSDSDLKHLAGSFVQACYSKINMFSSSIAGPRVHDDVISCYFQILDVIITSGQKRLHNYYCLLLCFFCFSVFLLLRFSFFGFFAFLFFCFVVFSFFASLLFSAKTF